MKAKFIGDIADHIYQNQLYDYLFKNNYIIEVNKSDCNEYWLKEDSYEWCFEENELNFIDVEGKFNHLKELIKGIPDRTSCVAYVVGYSKYNSDIDKDDLICILEYILNNKSNREV